MRLKGKVALITGASKGIGRGIGIRYAQEGASVVLASRSMDLLASVAEEVNKAGGQAVALPVDVRDSESIDEVVNKTVTQYGQIDIMVNNAGISMTKPSESLLDKDWLNALETDLFSVFYGCRAAGREMIKQSGGSIINIGTPE